MLTENEFSALGRAVFAFASLESVLVRLQMIDFDVTNIESKSYTQSDAQSAVTTPLSNLLNNAVTRMEKLEPTEDIRNYIDKYLKPSEDRHGRRLACPLIRWRNSLVHGAYKRMENGNLFIDFADKQTFKSMRKNNDFVYGGISAETNANEINQLALSVAQLTVYMLEVFEISEAPN